MAYTPSILAYSPSTLAQRSRFYAKSSASKFRRWWGRRPLPQLYALDAGTDTGIAKDPAMKGYLLYCTWSELPRKIAQHCPEDVYYDRNTYPDPKRTLRTLRFAGWTRQELVFDVDADNIPCGHPESAPVCEQCLAKARRAASALKRELAKEFRDIRMVYSGKGYHLHVFDSKAYLLTRSERKSISSRYAKYPIDPWVTAGGINLIRMPYSLNGLVNRRVLPLPSDRRNGHRR